MRRWWKKMRERVIRGRRENRKVKKRGEGIEGKGQEEGMDRKGEVRTIRKRQADLHL
jgi:hypothetical protein